MRPIGLYLLKAQSHYRNTPRGFTLLEMVVVLAILAALAGLVVPMIGDQQDKNTTITNQASLTALRDAFIGNSAGPGLYADVRYAFPTTHTSNDLRVSHLLWNRLDGTNATPVLAVYDLPANKGWRGPYVRGGAPIQNTANNASNVFPASGEKRFDGDATFGVRGFFPADANYGTQGEPAIGDAWGNPVILQIPALNPSGIAFSTPEEAWKFARVVSAGPDGELDTVLNGVHRQALAGKLANNTAPARGDDIVVYLNRVDVHE